MNNTRSNAKGGLGLFALIIALMSLSGIAFGSQPAFFVPTSAAGVTQNGGGNMMAITGTQPFTHPPVAQGTNTKEQAKQLVQIPPTTHDQQVFEVFTQNFNSIAYNVTALPQAGEYGYGPAYLINGLSNTGYWYQLGLSYNWSFTSGGFQGFQFVYDVWNQNDQVIYPTNGGGGTLAFSGPVNPYDKVLLDLYINGGTTYMYAYDWNTGANALVTYSSENSVYFVANTSSAGSSKGYFTGVMTEQVHTTSYNGTMQPLNYTIVPSSYPMASGWIMMDEFNTSNGQGWGGCYGGCTPMPFSGNTVYEFTVHGAVERANAHEFVTGSYPFTVMQPTPAEQSVSEGQPATVKASTIANGTDPYSYQWYEELPGDNSYLPVAGATSLSYSFPGSQSPGTYKFELQVADNASQQQNSDIQYSPAANVTVLPPKLSASISTNTVSMDEGQDAYVYSAVSGGMKPYSYQWMEKAPGASKYTDAPGCQSQNTYECNFQPTTSGKYSLELVVTDSANSVVTSDPVKITANPEFAVAATATSSNVYVKQSIKISAKVSGGTDPDSYQWYNCTVTCGAMAGKTGKTLSLKAGSVGTYKYYVEATDSASSPANASSQMVIVNVVTKAGGADIAANMTQDNVSDNDSEVAGNYSVNDTGALAIGTTDIPVTNSTNQTGTNETALNATIATMNSTSSV